MRPIEEDAGYQELQRQLRDLTMQLGLLEGELAALAATPPDEHNSPEELVRRWKHVEEQRDKVQRDRHDIVASIWRLKASWR